jgi:hypothetical protein
LASNEAEADPENHACTCASSSLWPNKTTAWNYF